MDLSRFGHELFDLAIIGGGVNGTGIARDAAGRGLSVLLLEQGDLACGTSSASTKLIHSGLRSPKGPVFDTAIVAGVMGAKRTHELIPFCHPLGLENCRITIELEGDTAVIRCTVSVHHKTGVEMEALTGASIAALTVYDMCKALSHDIVIGGLRLLAKDGGRSSYSLKATP